MSTCLSVPNSLRTAGRELRRAFAAQLEQLPKADFVRAWSALSYIFPGLHPDGYDNPDSGWPRVLKPFAAEAWRRNDAGELLDEEMYPSDAAWAGIFDRFDWFEQDEYERRLAIAAKYGERSNA